MSLLNKKQTALLEKIAVATKSDAGFMYSDGDSKEHKALISLGYIETNERDVPHDAAGNVATRATPEGFAALSPEADTHTNEGTSTMTTAQTAAAPAAAKSKFAIVSVALPTAKRGGGRTGSTYPFADLEIGQSFFVAASEDRPDPAKSLASTVTSANERYSEVIPGETRKNRKGNIVPATKQLRAFAIRSIEDGAAWGFPGVKGAAVGRIELTDAEDEAGDE